MFCKECKGDTVIYRVSGGNAKIVVLKEITIYEGIATPQNIYDNLGNVIGTLPGGGNQVYIPTVEARWFQ